MISVNYAGYDVDEEQFGRVFRPAGSGEYTFVYFSVPMNVLVGDSTITVPKDSCILYGPEDIQDFSQIYGTRMSFVHFSAKESDIRSYGIRATELLLPECKAEIKRLLKMIQSEFFSRDLFYEDRAAALVRELFITLARERMENKLNEEAGRPLYDLFCQARYTILSNCDKEWASTNMCQMVSLSRSQFYKYYNDFFGVSPMADLASARIEKAKFLLTNRELQVTEVAKYCGYASIHHFSRTFKEHTGLSPLSYVKKVTGLTL